METHEDARDPHNGTTTGSDADSMVMHRSSKMIEIPKPGSDTIRLGAVYAAGNADGDLLDAGDPIRRPGRQR